MADLQQTVGSVIRRERHERRFTLKELAERAMISVVYLSEIERGKKYPSPVVVERLADALDLSVPDLLSIVAEALREELEPRVAQPIGFRPPAQAVTEYRPGAAPVLPASTVVHLLGELSLVGERNSAPYRPRVTDAVA